MKLFKIPLVASDVFVQVNNQTKYIIGDLDSFTEITAAESAAETVVMVFGGGSVTFTTDGADADEKHANSIKIAAYMADRIAQFSGDKRIQKGAVADLIPSISKIVSDAGLTVTGGDNLTAIATIAQS